MGSSILGIGQTALAAAQAGLTTTSHNIANVNTPGYSRQVVIQSTAGAQSFGAGYLGKGTQVATVQRVYSDFLSRQVQSAQSQKYNLDTYGAQIDQVENMLADSDAGLTPALQGFFSSVQSLTSNPDTARQTMLSSAQSLAARFNSLDAQLSDIRSGVESQIKDTLSTINGYAKQIADLNDAIAKAQGTNGATQPANDLLDQRDQLISELSKQVKVSIVKQDNSYNVFIGTGQPLVIDKQSFTLTGMPSPTDSARTAIGYDTPAGTVLLDEHNFTGGALGGLLEFRSQTLDPAQSQLGRIATAFAMSFNAQHELGQDKNGALGQPFFSVATPVTSPNNANTGDLQIDTTLTDGTALTGSDYKIRYAGGNFEITRLSDQKLVYTGATLPSTPTTAVDGMMFSTGSGTVQDGDEYVVQPTVNGARGISVLITDPSQIAAAAPIRTTAPSTNTGTGKISVGTVNAQLPTDPNLQQPVKIVFTSATTYDVIGTGTGNPTSLTYAPGTDITYNGWTIQISGTPATGDSFSIDPNTNGSADTRNANALAGLQTGKMVYGGLTYQGAYSQIVSAVGTKAQQVKTMGEAADNLLANATAAQQGVSGVNLDEEATNLLRYQQAYQAAGKIMQTANQLFDMLLNLGGN
jgi:flagellar hook-associated protein 1 FlgK